MCIFLSFFFCVLLSRVFLLFFLFVFGLYWLKVNLNREAGRLHSEAAHPGDVGLFATTTKKQKLSTTKQYRTTVNIPYFPGS